MPSSFETTSMESTASISECSTYPSSTPSTSSSSSSSEPLYFPSSWNVIPTTTPVNATPTVTIPQPLTLPVMFHICHATPPTTTTTAASSSNIVVVTPRDDDDPSTTMSSSSSASSSSSSSSLLMVPIQSMEDCRPSIHQNPNESQIINFSSTSSSSHVKPTTVKSGMRLNKFVRRLHDMLQSEDKLGIVEWRRGLLVLHSTDAFAKTVLPKYFNTRNFKTFRRQLNYYGFVHVRSFSTTTPSPTSLGSGSSGGDLSSTCTALWVHRELAQLGAAAVNISSVLNLHRVEPCESSKTAEGRRARKELAVSTVEEDIGVDAKTLQLEQIQAMAFPRAVSRTPMTNTSTGMKSEPSFYMHYQNNTPLLPRETSDYESAANLLLMLSKSVVC